LGHGRNGAGKLEGGGEKTFGKYPNDVKRPETTIVARRVRGIQQTLGAEWTGQGKGR